MVITTLISKAKYRRVVRLPLGQIVSSAYSFEASQRHTIIVQELLEFPLLHSRGVAGIFSQFSDAPRQVCKH